MISALLDRDFVTDLIEQLKYVARSCPCGARSESPRTHPHVCGCPIGTLVACGNQALSEASGPAQSAAPSSPPHPVPLSVENAKVNLDDAIRSGTAAWIRRRINELILAVEQSSHQEIERLKAELRGWRDAGSGQPADEHGCPVSDPYPHAELNFAWCVGRSAFLDSDVFKVMVSRAGKASEWAEKYAHADAALTARQATIDRLVTINTQLEAVLTALRAE